MGTHYFEVILVWVQIVFMEMAQFIKLSDLMLLPIYEFFISVCMGNY